MTIIRLASQVFEFFNDILIISNNKKIVFIHNQIFQTCSIWFKMYCCHKLEVCNVISFGCLSRRNFNICMRDTRVFNKSYVSLHNDITHLRRMFIMYKRNITNQLLTVQTRFFSSFNFIDLLNDFSTTPIFVSCANTKLY